MTTRRISTTYPDSGFSWLRLWWVALLTAALTLVFMGGAQSAGRRPGRVKPVPKPVQRGDLLNAALVEASSLINAPQARLAFGVDGSGFTAAVLDTGVRATHQDFSGRVVAQVNYTSDNGGDTGDAADGDGHGTNVSGIVVANGNHTGIAPGADLAAIKVLENDGSGSFDDVSSGLDWVIANRTTYNITVVNLSLGDGGNYTSMASDSFKTKLQTLRSAGVAVCTAAGNDYYGWNSEQGMGYPAIFPETVSVGAVYDANIGAVNYGDGSSAYSTADDRICPFSQRLHSNVSATNRTDVFAPGAAITSSGITSDTSSSTDHGTSQATPMAAGVILLLQESYQRTTGALPTVDQLEKWLRAGAVSINDGDDEDDNVTNTGLSYQRIDALAALEAAQQEESTSYSISGTVTESGTGVPGVTVTAGNSSATTQNDGTYSITGLTTGVYTVTPSKSGYSFSPVSRTVSVSANVTNVRFTTSKTSYSISGTVRTSSGLGLSGASLTCGTLSATSDTNGNYTFTGLSADTYTVSVSRSGYSFSPSSQTVTVGPDATGVDFFGTPDQTATYSIRGTVLAGGSGLSGVTVSAGSTSTVTGASGTYSLSGLPEGRYTVTAARSGYIFSPASRSVTLTSNVTGIDFTATLTTYSISGTVRQGTNGLSGVTVTAGVKSTTTDSLGRYTLSGLAAGSYTVTPLASGYSFTPASVTLTLTSNQSGVDFVTTTTTSRITGRITQGGSGLEGIAVSVGSTIVSTDASGNYVATGLQPGSYTVRPSGTGLQFSPNSRTVTVGPDRSGIDFSAVSLLQISGRVTMNGSGVAGITVSTGTRSAITNDSGNYYLENVPSGTYTLTPSGGGYTFTPASRTVTLSGSNVSELDFAVVTEPQLTSLEPNSAQLRGGKSLAIQVRFDRAVTANTYVYLNSSAAQGKVPKRILLRRGRASTSFTLQTRAVKQEIELIVTGTANGISKQASIILLPKAAAR